MKNGRYRVSLPDPQALGASIGFLHPVTYRQLVDRFGEPFVLPEPEEADGRIQVIWKIVWADGSVNEIYDYKVGPFWLGPFEGVPYEDVTEWDVSGDAVGYDRLVEMFDVEPEAAERVANRARMRPELSQEILTAMKPSARLKRRLLR